ncbi:MAG: SurA N-terminal domain-containing protein [Gammaproteobacteria bacterium]
MLGAIKNKSKGWVAYLIVGLLSVPFALFGIQQYLGGSNNQAVAKVYGEEIDYNSYAVLLDSNRRQNQVEFGSDYTTEIDNILKQKLIDLMINQKLFDMMIDSLGLVTVEQEVRESIRGNAKFYEKGVFSKELYNKRLRLEGYDETRVGVYEDEQSEQLRSDQLTRNLTQSALITSIQSDQLNALAAQEREVAHIAFNATSFADQVVIDDAQVSEYYNNNLANFVSPPQVKVNYIELSRSNIAIPTDADEETLLALYDDEQQRFAVDETRKVQHILVRTEQEASSILDQINSGADFFEMAKEYSIDYSTNIVGGDLGYFERERMVPEFDKVVFELNAGETSGVVKTQFGYHIIRVNDIAEASVKSFAEVRIQLQEIYIEKAITTELYSLQTELASLAYEEPIDIVADQFGLKLQSSEFFSATSSAYDKAFIEAAYSDIVLGGDNSDVLEIGAKYVVLNLADQQSESQKALNDVYAEVETTLKAIEAKAVIADLAKEIADELSSGNHSSANSLISDNGLEWKDEGWIGRRTELPFGVAVTAYKMPVPTDSNASYIARNMDGLTTILVRVSGVRLAENGESGWPTVQSFEIMKEWSASLIKSLRESAEESGDIRIFSEFL